MRKKHYKVDGGKVHAFCGKQEDVSPLRVCIPVYECGVHLRVCLGDATTLKPITCQNCLRVIANKKRKKAKEIAKSEKGMPFALSFN